MALAASLDLTPPALPCAGAQRGQFPLDIGLIPLRHIKAPVAV
jgi:hypothetical protein